MDKLTRGDLYSLEVYHAKRAEMRREVMAHKAIRKGFIGPHAVIYFEDRLTIQYQIQEMLRVERIFEAVSIEEELETYNPLIPDGDNLKATFMLEYDDGEERGQALARLIGIQDRVWLRADEFEPVFAVADEDVDRENEEKTSAVHFLRFLLETEMIAAIRTGAPLGIGIDHENYNLAIAAVSPATREALAGNFD